MKPKKGDVCPVCKGTLKRPPAMGFQGKMVRSDCNVCKRTGHLPYDYELGYERLAGMVLAYLTATDAKSAWADTLRKEIEDDR